jgi:hypothetical protein
MTTFTAAENKIIEGNLAAYVSQSGFTVIGTIKCSIPGLEHRKVSDVWRQAKKLDVSLPFFHPGQDGTSQSGAAVAAGKSSFLFLPSNKICINEGCNNATVPGSSRAIVPQGFICNFCFWDSHNRSETAYLKKSLGVDMFAVCDECAPDG